MMLETVSMWNEDVKKKHKVGFIEYLYLISIFWNTAWKHVVFSDELKQKMLDKGFVERNEDDIIVLTEKGNAIFVPEESLFEEFLNTFPTRVTDAQGKPRVLSPARITAGGAQRLFKDWYNITKNDKLKERHIIACLKAEVNLRKNTGNLFYMRTAESWLEKATWEDYEYLLRDDDNNPKPSTSRDLRL